MEGADVAITNSQGNSPCVETTITTDALGAYTCTLKPGEVAPFFIVVTDPTGESAPLVSVSTTTPTAGVPMTVNITPLTTAIVSQLSTDGNPLSLVGAGTVDPQALRQATSNVVAQIASVLSSLNAPAGYDPFSTSITAATAEGTGNAADLVLDVVKVAVDSSSGKLAFSTLENPTPVLLANATSTGVVLDPPSPGMDSLTKATQLAALAFKNCFAVPLNQRVLGIERNIPVTEGGPSVTGVAEACEDIVADESNGAGMDFLHNGYGGGQFLFGLLTSESMTGANFSVPEILAFYPADSNNRYDRAILNIKYVDKDKNPGNVITLASKIPDSATSKNPTSWWLTGNQQGVDVSIRLNIRRVEQLKPSYAAYVSGTNSTNFSTFQTGMQLHVNTAGPGSFKGVDPLMLARLTGPGLPSNGLVYKRSTQAGQASMDLLNKTGSLTVGSQCGNGTTANCPNLWFERTTGISGSAATILATNPNNFVWAQPVDNVNTGLIVKGAKYRVELFYGSNTSTPGYVVNKVLLSDMVPATAGVSQPWNNLGEQSRKVFDPSDSLASAQTALNLDWVQNLAAQQINGVQAVINEAGTYGSSKPVPRGATSAVLNNGTNVPAYSADSGSRVVLFSYRMLDGSNKTAVYRYN